MFRLLSRGGPCYHSIMTRLNLTDQEIHKTLYGMTVLEAAKRAEVEKIIHKMNAADDWFPEAFRRELKALQSNEILTEFERHKVERAFFPDHSW